MSAVVRVDDETNPEPSGEGESPPGMTVVTETEPLDAFHDSGETSPDVWHVSETLGEAALGPVEQPDRKWSLQAESNHGGCQPSRANMSSYPEKIPAIIATGVLTASPKFMFTLNVGSGCKNTPKRTAHAVPVSATVVEPDSDRSRLRVEETPLAPLPAGGLDKTVAPRERAVNGDRVTMMNGARLPSPGIKSLRPGSGRLHCTEKAQAATADTLGIAR